MTQDDPFARALDLAAAGRDEAARAAFEAARARRPDEVAVELALLDLRAGRPPREVVRALDAVLARAPQDGLLAARALHVKGRTLAAASATGEAVACLQRALGTYTARGELAREAEVLDTLGMAYAFDGQLEPAGAYYALAIARKALSGDARGTAVTLGNLGRLLLDAGRAREALECFRLDGEIARTVGDRRGEARMANDMGRARLALGDLDGAVRALEACRELARAGAFPDVGAFAAKDLALALLAQERERGRDDGRLARAAAAFAEGRTLLAGRDDPYAAALLAHAEGLLEQARGGGRAVDLLAGAARDLEACRAPDALIPVLVDLAGALAAAGRGGEAHAVLARALRHAQQDGQARHLAPVREALAALDLPEGAALEEGVLALGPERRPEGGAYTVLAHLGSGGFGDVHLALDVRHGREVAIKVLRLEELYDPAERAARRASIRVEVEAASRVRHPGVARVHALGTDDQGRTYVVQEYVRGAPLAARLAADGSAPLAEVLAVGRDLADALQALHDAGVVHRDVKPGNVVLTPGGRPVLIDMGVAWVPRSPHALGRGAPVGTLAYMAPEQATGKRVDGRADVYALGVVLFEWLTGFQPLHLPEADVAAAVRAIRRVAPLALAPLRPDAPPALATLLEAMLAKSPRRRPTAHEVARRLDALRAALGGEAGGREARRG